uniref:Proline dehydrogenase n=1 Tax=Panagrolaimus superbus TaxID=310955 RepID=A0A914YTR0_9BILA
MPLNPGKVSSISTHSLLLNAYRLGVWQPRLATPSYLIHRQNHNSSQTFLKSHNSPLSRASVVSVASSVTPSTEVIQEVDKCYNKLDLTFENAREAFKSKTNFELFRALLVLRLCSVDFLVQQNQRILQLLRKTLGPTLFKRILKSTFYGHFVAGENLEEIAPTVQKIRNFGVKSILDYSVESDISQEEAEEKAVEGIVGDQEIPQAVEGVVDEKTIEATHQRYTVHKEFGDRRVDVINARTYFYTSEKECDKNVEVFCNCIDAVAEATRREGFTAIKLTALGRPQLLLKLSETIAQTQNFFKALTGSTWENLVLGKISEDKFLKRLKEFGIKTDSKMVQEWFKMVDFDDDGFVDYYDWGRLLDENKELTSMFSVLNIKTGKVEPLIQNLSQEEEQEFANMMQRLVHVADYAQEKGVRIMIDAEQTYFQPAISRLTVALMRKYNKNGGQILNTYQAYLKNALSNIEIDMHLARRENFHFGCKLVRGAYMDQERKRAKAVGYEDPINPTYESTNDMYNKCLGRIIKEREERGVGQVSVMVASHNEQSVRNAVQMMKDSVIAPSERVICFAQLYGMCDQISFSLGQAGYSVYKYVPYGPVEDVLPYLSRRALENGSMLKKVQRERNLLWREFKRRLLSGQFIYNVPT